MVPVVHIGVGHDIVVALGIDVDLVIVVVVVIDVVVDVGHDGEDVHGGGQEGHLGDVYGCSICHLLLLDEHSRRSSLSTPK